MVSDFFIWKSTIMFSTTCAHAIRALAYLAEIPEGVYVLGRDIASVAEIPANYLSKILLSLRNAGFIATARGSAGGYRLSRHPSDISLLQVVELFEKSPLAEPCFLNRAKSCPKDNPCMAHLRWGAVRDVYTAFLTSTSLEEITRNKEGAAAKWRRKNAAPELKSRGGVPS